MVRDLDDPASLMQVCTRMSDLISDLAGIPNWRARAERMVPDMQLGVERAVLHAGYPIMMFLPKAETLVDPKELMQCSLGNGFEKRGTWGFPHELGRQVRRNLGPFFQAWGVPTSASARASIADLPVWMPEELPARPQLSVQ